MLFCLILTLFTAGTVGLSIYFDKTRASTTSMDTVSVTAPPITKKEPDAKEAVLILNTAMNSNVAMVIRSTGEFHFDFFIKIYRVLLLFYKSLINLYKSFFYALVYVPLVKIGGHHSHGRLSYFLSFLDA